MLQDSDSIQKSFEAWWADEGSFFLTQLQEEEDEAVAADVNDMMDDAELEDLDEAENCFNVPIQEMDLGEPTSCAQKELGPEQKLRILEDRSRVCEWIDEATASVRSGSSVTVPRADLLPPMKADHVDDAAVSFEVLHAQLSSQACFQQGPSSRGATACLQRMELMKDLLADLTLQLRVAEGLLSKAVVLGSAPGENEYNLMKHELHLARQYAKYRGSRTSRLASWMVAQEALVASSGDSASEKHEQPIHKVDAFRPVSDGKCQFVVFRRLQGPMVTYHIGMVMSIYRGSLSKRKTDSRRITMSKPLSQSSPSSLVSKVKVLLMQPLQGSILVANGLCEHIMVDALDICGEVLAAEEGIKGSVVYVSFSKASLTVVQSLNDGTLRFGEEPASALRANAKVAAKAPLTFTVKAFSKSQAGSENILTLVQQ